MSTHLSKNDRRVIVLQNGGCLLKLWLQSLAMSTPTMKNYVLSPRVNCYIWNVSLKKIYYFQPILLKWQGQTTWQHQTHQDEKQHCKHLYTKHIITILPTLWNPFSQDRGIPPTIHDICHVKHNKGYKQPSV